MFTYWSGNDCRLYLNKTRRLINNLPRLFLKICFLELKHFWKHAENSQIATQEHKAWWEIPEPNLCEMLSAINSGRLAWNIYFKGTVSFSIAVSILRRCSHEQKLRGMIDTAESDSADTVSSWSQFQPCQRCFLKFKETTSLFMIYLDPRFMG